MKLYSLVVVVLLLAGCSGSTPEVDLDPGYVDGWAFAIAGASGLGGATPPAPAPPAPTPTPGGKCANCNGTGRLPGDGRISPICPECDGTGKAGAPPIPMPDEPAPKPAGKASLGVTVGDVTDSARTRFKISAPNGAVVTKPAEKFPAGAVIYEIDSRRIRTADDLVAAIAGRAPGDRVVVGYWIGSRYWKQTVTLREASAPKTKPAAPKQPVVVRPPTQSFAPQWSLPSSNGICGPECSSGGGGG